jgi:hypothetical protein
MCCVPVGVSSVCLLQGAPHVASADVRCIRAQALIRDGWCACHSKFPVSRWIGLFPGSLQEESVVVAEH